MSNNGNIQSQTVEIKPSVLVVQFDGAAFQAKLNNVSPAQLSAFLVWLEWYLKRTFDQQADMNEPSKLEVPK